jgi:hypothetical protein
VYSPVPATVLKCAVDPMRSSSSLPNRPCLVYKRSIYCMHHVLRRPFDHIYRPSQVRSGGYRPAGRPDKWHGAGYNSSLSFTFLDMSLSIDSRLALRSEASIPQFGFGSTPETYASVTRALELGIRHCQCPRNSSFASLMISRHSSDVYKRRRSRTCNQ